MGNPFEGFTQGAVTYQQVGHKVYEQQLPGGQVQTVLYEYAGYEQDGSDRYEQQAAARAPLFMMMMVLVFAMLAMMIVMLVLMMMLVFAMMIVLTMMLVFMMLLVLAMIVMM